MSREFVQTDQVLDRSVLDDLAAIDDGLLADVLDSFLKDVPARIAAIRAAVDAADNSAIARAAHALKGSALAVGAIPLVALCEALEHAAHQGRRDHVLASVTALDPAFARVRGALEGRC